MNVGRSGARAVHAAAAAPQVVRSLGRPDIARDVVEALLVDRGYDRGFDAAVEREAAEAAQSEDRAAAAT